MSEHIYQIGDNVTFIDPPHLEHINGIVTRLHPFGIKHGVIVKITDEPMVGKMIAVFGSNIIEPM